MKRLCASLAISIVALLSACGGAGDSLTVADGTRNHQAAVLLQSAPATTLPGYRASYSIARINNQMELTIIASGEKAVLPTNSIVHFGDISLAFDIDGNAGKVYRLYQAAFKRVPDLAGLNYWIDNMNRSGNIQAIATAFAASTEFKTIYGINPSNADIVAQFYRNVLLRDGDAAGIAYWLGKLNARSMTVPQLLAEFAESAEGRSLVLPAISNGIAFRQPDLAYLPFAQAVATVADEVGATVTLDGSQSLTSPGRPMNFAWQMTSRPAASNAALSQATSARPTFVPDAVGVYAFSLTVGDGQNLATPVTVTATIAMAALPYTPLEAHYSKGLDKLVVVAANPNLLYILDAFSGTSRSVALPIPVKAFSLSPDGKLAIVLHESVASLVDLVSGQLLKSFATGGSHTDAFITNAAVAYFIGQTGGQWVRPSVVLFNARTGADLTPPEIYMGMFYGTQRGVYASSLNKVLLMSNGLSPADIDYFTISPTTNAVTAMGDSPYHGDYPMSAPLYLSENESIVFTSSGNYFRADTLKYAGTFSLKGALLSLSNSTAKDETVVIAGTYGDYPNYLRTYPSSYSRFTGPLFFPAADGAFPQIGGKQSYGRQIFHSADGRRLALVQTGSAVESGSGARYYLVTP